jgi:hypothetical protein
LTEREREALSVFVGEPANPETVDDFNAWADAVAERADMSVPEERLMAAVYQQMKLQPLD